MWAEPLRRLNLSEQMLRPLVLLLPPLRLLPYRLYVGKKNSRALTPASLIDYTANNNQGPCKLLHANVYYFWAGMRRRILLWRRLCKQVVRLLLLQIAICHATELPTELCGAGMGSASMRLIPRIIRIRELSMSLHTVLHVETNHDGYQIYVVQEELVSNHIH